MVELSAGFLSLPADDWLRLVERVHSYGLKAKPELGIQFGADRGTYIQIITWDEGGNADLPN